MDSLPAEDTREAQEYWSGWPIPSPGDLPDPGIEPGSPALQADSLPAEPQGKPLCGGHQPISNFLLILAGNKDFIPHSVVMCP